MFSRWIWNRYKSLHGRISWTYGWLVQENMWKWFLNTGNTFVGRKSFPSAHATFAFSGMFFMTLRICRILKIQDPGRHKGWKCLSVIIPVIFAVLIGVSRTCDYHHHYSGRGFMKQRTANDYIKSHLIHRRPVWCDNGNGNLLFCLLCLLLDRRHVF